MHSHKVKEDLKNYFHKFATYFKLMATSIYFWIGFHVFIFIMLALDLGVFHKHTHKIPVKEAVIWVVVWVALAILFNLFIYFELGKIKALEFLTGYVIEYSLS